MPLHVENHPFSALSRQIERLICTSLVLVFIEATVALINFGQLSLLAAPVLFLITLLHNLILIMFISRDRRRTTAELKGTLAPTATLAAVITTWALVALWIIVALVITVIAGLLMAHNMLDTLGRTAAWVELPLVVVETCVLSVLAAKCGKQRRSTIVLPETVDWNHLRPPVTARPPMTARV